MPDQPHPAPSVIVTGAAAGIGQATVAALVKSGARVLAFDINDGVHDVAATAPDQIVSMVGDASDGPTVEKMVATAMQRFGRLDGLFCNAGISGGTAPVTEYPEEMFEKVLRINLWSVFLGMRHAIPALRATGGGSIVSTSSSAALKGSLNISAYTASKHAVLGLTRSVALEVAKDGIRVNTIAPGPTETPMFLGHKKDPHAAAASMSPMGRMAQAEEQAEVARWLLLDAPPYLTGTVIPVDGGLTAK